MAIKTGLQKIVERESKCFSQVFGRLPVAIEKGEGVFVYDFEGKRYLDMFSGIAVNSLGHAHPKIIAAIKDQAEKLMHISNWVYTLPQVELAEKIVELAHMEKVFFSNDGTGAVETALKLSRKATGKKEIIAFKNSFHGRTMGALSLTWDEKYKKPFEPLVPGIKHSEFGDIEALEKTITNDTGAVIIEPIQGEAGINMPKEGFLSEVRDLTRDKDILLIIDECQTGFGRTGKMFGFQHENVEPDILILAKALGSGFPISATVFNDIDFEKGQQGGTFNGNPLACKIALTSIETIINEKLVENSKNMGDKIQKELKQIGVESRGSGLMIGFDVEDGHKTVLKLIENEVLTIYSKNTIRVLPPLIINKENICLFIESLKKAI